MALVGAQFVNAVSPSPVGVIEAYAGASAPSGWLLCDGAQTLITAYPELYSVLGTTYGALTNGSGGAGSTHFRVPDLRGRMPVGAGNDGTAANNATRTRGATGGDTRMPTHNHGVTDPGHLHRTHVSLGGGSAETGVSGTGNPGYYQNYILTNVTTDSRVTGISINNNGSGSGENMPPFLVTNYIIKAVPDAPRSGLAYGSTPPIVTALPSNPQFGDVVTYIADAANGVAWNLQYDATGTYPWKFIGGAALIAGNATGGYGISEIGPTTTYVQTLAGSPSITLPLPGDYRARVTAVGRASNSSAAPGLWISFGGATCPNWNSSDSIATGITGGSAHPLAANKTGTVTAGQTVTLNYTNANLGGSATFYNIRLDAVPVRVARA